MITALVIISSVMPIIFICVELKKGGAAGVVAKTVASLGFIALGAACFAGCPDKTGMFVILGLVCGLCGDIFLGIYKPWNDESHIYLPAGMAVFGLEHILVMTAVFIMSGRNVTHLLISIAVGVIVSVLTIVCEKNIMKFNFGKDMLYSVFYAFILASALIYYILTAAFNPEFIIVLIGMILFFISDMILSVIYFGGKFKSKALTAANLLTYYAGQILFALSLGSCFYRITASII